MDGFWSSLGDALSSAWESITVGFWPSLFGSLNESVYRGFLELNTMMNDLGSDLFSLGWVEAYLAFVRMVGWGLTIMGAVLALLDMAIAYQDMHAIRVREQVLPLVGSALAAYLFCTLPVELYRFAVQLQHSLVSELLVKVFHQPMETKPLAEWALDALWHTVTDRNALVGLIFLIAFIYSFLRCFIGNLSRGGSLLILISVAPFHLLGLPRGQTEGFRSWCRQVAGLCLTAFLQNLLLVMGLVTIPSQLLMGVGLLFAATEVPRLAGRFGMESSLPLPHVAQVVRPVTRTGRTLLGVGARVMRP